MSTFTNENSNTGYGSGIQSQQPVFKSKSEKLAYLKKEVAENSRLNPQRAQNITLINSLVKYDTPYLISSTSKNKKTLEDLKESEEDANTYFILINNNIYFFIFFFNFFNQFRIYFIKFFLSYKIKSMFFYLNLYFYYYKIIITFYLYHMNYLFYHP